ncbi:MAG: carbohydrate kinase family protein [Candidatus Thorarchaeota archaeon]
MYEIVVIGNPTFLLQSELHRLSGPSVYSATTLTKLGTEQIAIVSSLSPSLREEFVRSVNALGIPEYFIVTDDGESVRQIGPSDETEPSIEFLGVPHTIGIRDIPDEFLRARAILLCPSLQEINSELIEWICNSSDSLIFLNPQLQSINSEGRLEYLKELDLMEKTHCFIDVLQPNEKEAMLITGESDPYLAAELLVEWASEVCIVTLGDRGSLIYDGSEYQIIPPFKTNPVDSYEAGSVYMSGFASQHLQGKSLSECGAYASSLASIKIESNALDFDVNQEEISKRFELVSESVEIR